MSISHKSLQKQNNEDFSNQLLYSWLYKITLRSIPNYWKHLLRTETSQKYIIKTFCCNNKVTKSLIMSLKDFQSSLIKNFTFPSIPEEEHYILSPDIRGKILLIHDWFKKC